MFNTILAALILSFDFETGYVPNNHSLVFKRPSEYNSVTYDRSFYLSMSPRAQWKFFYCDFDFMYFASPGKETNNFCPYRGVWGGEVGITYKYFTIGYANQCSHKIMPQSYSYDGLNTVDTYYDKIFFRVSFSNRDR